MAGRQDEFQEAMNQGHSAAWDQNWDRAAVFYRQALEEFPEHPQALTNLGVSYQAVGELAKARQHLERALALHQCIDDRRGEALVAGNLGLLLHDMGDNEAARQYCEQALKIRQAVGDRSGEGYSLTYLALTLEGLGDWAGAADAYQQALHLRRELGQAARAIDDLAGLVRVALQRGDIEGALTYTDEILVWIEAQGIGGLEYPLRVYLACADALDAAGRADRAEKVLTAASDFLQARADQISDESTRTSFLENVPVHQQLCERLARHE